MQVLLGVLLSAAISYIAYRLHALTGTGALAATGLGTLIFAAGGWIWALLLLAFFGTSSGLSRMFSRRKVQFGEKYAKAGPRDAGQVLGNGGIAALFSAAHAFAPQTPWPALAYAAALAAVNADTWATELGVLAPTEPRLITHLARSVEAGTSGGITLTGLLAAASGSAVIAALASLLFASDGMSFFLPIAAGGLLGSLLDSFLGATVQAMYVCPADGRETERHPRHSCGTATLHVRGWNWLNNDWVNAACSAFGALSAVLLAALPIP